MPLERLYQEEILELARVARQISPLTDATVNYTVRNPICGDEVTIYLSINSQGLVKKYGHKVRGCALCEASAGLVSKKVIGLKKNILLNINQNAKDWLNGINNDFIFNEIKTFTPVKEYKNRHKCILLSFNALSGAFEANS
tara:strand:- start:13 stop:435 length:423 start_codon:yes stop_codon:yes gene_type:complete